MVVSASAAMPPMDAPPFGPPARRGDQRAPGPDDPARVRGHAPRVIRAAIATARTPIGWSVELRIPVRTLSFGDPLGRADSWLAGADFTYATSPFHGDKNFLVGAWSLATGRENLTGDATAGVNTRLRWTLRPVADLFVVYSHNLRSQLDRWQLDSNRLLVKLQYAWRV